MTAASQEGGAAVTVSLTEVSAGRDVYIQVDTALRDEPFRHNRHRMLEKVRLIWINGLLEPSLDQLAWMELGLEPEPDAVDRPFDLFVQRPQQAPQPLPTGMPISHIFDAAGKALLILGEPGAGKTTLLLELTRDLLDRAAQDERHLIPVVFHLSSWAEQRLALADWLMDELNKRYDVPRKLAKTWVDADLLLPLLDGLDEVAADHREACVEAINAFLHAHGLLPLVVCSRRAEYAALTVRLRVPSAVLIQALRRQQVQSYVDQAGAALAGLRTALQHDESLWELLNTPLLLSIAAFAYKGRSVDEISAFGTGEAYRAQLFAAYTDAMFHRRARTTPYSREQTEHWLTWLARAMKDHNQSIFYVEGMQPNWVTDPRQQQSIGYILTFLDLIVTVLFGVLSIEMFSTLLDIERDTWLWMLGGGGAIYLFTLLRRFFVLPKFQVKLKPSNEEEIKCVEKIRWSWSAVPLVHKIIIIIVFITAGLGGVLLGGRLVSGLYGLAVGLAVGIFWLVYGLQYGQSGLIIGEIALHSYPNEGIKRSMQNGLITSLSTGLLCVLFGRLQYGRWDFALLEALVVGQVVGYRYGGGACLYHYALRLVLWYNNFAPLNYIRFLDYAAARIFLRKVGGGYVFVHRMLLEYFAARHQTSAEQHNCNTNG